MPNFSVSSLQHLRTCDPRLQEIFLVVINHFDCKIIQGHRDQAGQDKAFLEGTSKLRWPLSKHNTVPSRAVDAVPYPIDWRDHSRFKYFAGFVKGIAASKGIKLRWGGDWDMDTDLKDQNFNDLPHFELVD